jgi:hypothetical protein
MNLIVRVDMFTATQMAYVTSPDGEVQKTFTMRTNSMDREILNICEQENISNVIISGPIVYTKGFEKKIKQAELVKYNKKTLNITLIK